MIAGVATGINEKGAFGADGAPTEIRAPAKHARPVVNEPLLHTPCASHAVSIGDTTLKGTGVQVERSSGWATSRQWATHPVGTTVTLMRRPQWGQKRGGSSARPQPGQSAVIRPQPVQ